MGAFNRWEVFKRERRLFSYLIYYNELNITVYSIRFCVNRILTAGLTAYLEIEHDIIRKTDVNQAMKLIN